MLDFQWDRGFVYLIFEYCIGGDLGSILRLKRSFPEKIVQHFLQQLASALKYLRDNDIVHLDLKPHNILITGIQFLTLLHGLHSFKIWRHVILKIADFGFAQYLGKNESIDQLRGSPLYMAPEILKRQKYDARADLWSIGIILFECLFGRPPLYGMSTAELMNAFLNNQVKITYPSNTLSQICISLLKELLKILPDQRISFTNFFSHPFIDLEHMPTKDSYQKAQDIIKVANNHESNFNFKSAFYSFREALLYLMPLYSWGVPGMPFPDEKKVELKSQISRYMDKAEEMQQKSDIIKVEPKLLEEIQTIYNIIDRARDLSSKDLCSKSLSKYKTAIGLSLDIIKNNDARIRTEFFGEIGQWMTEAENVKDRCPLNYDEDKKVDKAIEIQACAINPDDLQPKPDYYKLKEPEKNNIDGHSKLKHLDLSNTDDSSDEADNETMCIIQ